MRRRVVITGMGAITPLGHNVRETIDAQLHGRNGVGLVHSFNAQRFPTQFAAQVKNFDLSKFIPSCERWAHSGINSQFAAVAAEEALQLAGLLDDDRVNRDRFGVYLGSGEGIQDFHNLLSWIYQSYRRETRQLDTVSFERGTLSAFHPEREAEQELHTTPAHLATHFDLRGPNYNCLTACAASSQAVGEATELIRHGDADLMLVGGAHSMIHPFGITGFNLLTALSTRNDAPEKASRPFDLNRDGFVLGEGAAMLILEDLEHARRRGADILAEVSGYGSTADAFRVTDSHPDGRGAIACIEGALKDSGLNRSEIGYINAHGTSTKVNDSVETLAIKKVFGEQAYQIPVSSTKSMMGHLIAAAGAVELITCVEVLRRGVMPPTINYETPDPECDLDYIPATAREKRVHHALSNSFGFGGQNISLIVSRFTS
ncbi:MAG TPA: beta-ketoacyl-[acyl-carrier-protein] synthase family protein [Gemmataceae bacterium]|nr:beta-ketoacyl-[acyl-carrier-protein] synthase family protein [Gemmataceae bacterium]